jgi:histidine triad (HIT) family protein
MANSIFTKIINGEIPSYKIYEDEKTFAFLDIHPVQPGMVLVVSKVPAETFLDLTDEDSQALWRTTRLVANKMKQAFPDKKRIGIQIEGLDVPHVHVKLIPINSGDEFRAKPDMSADPDNTSLEEMAQKLAF